MSSKTKIALAVLLGFIFISSMPFLLLCILKRAPSAITALPQIRITIPEGYSSRDIAEKFVGFKNFNKDNFLKIADGKEGYLFPDTYFFTLLETEEEIIKKMEDNFKEKAGDVKPEIIVMASILEKEALTPEDKKIVSGILWKRLETGMLLQVDAVFAYIIDKKSSDLTLDDLKIDSPYNTYLYKGLPPAPICNPGIESIEAALNPTSSSYWYYLSDKNLNIHFAKNFDEHKLNKAKYLR